MSCRVPAILVLAAVLAGADPVAATLDDLRAANALRGELAREHAAWAAERQRLEALVAATEAEAAAQAEAAAAAGRRRAAAERAAALARSDLGAVRRRVDEAGRALAAALAAAARAAPPGAVPQPEPGGGFEAATQALERAERAAGAVAVEVVAGTRDGRTEAVKLLRVAGAAAWWTALDGSAAGTARWRDGRLDLIDGDDAVRRSVLAAIAQAEGRAQPGIVLLPGGAP